MGIEIRLPRITGVSERDRLNQIEKYLYQFREQVQFGFDSIEPAPAEAIEGEQELTDISWRNLGLSDEVTASAVDVGRNGGGCYYRVIDSNHIHVAFNCAFVYNGAALIINSSKIPLRWRPSRDIYALVPGDAGTVIKIKVDDGGNIAVDQVVNLAATGIALPTTINWIDGYLDYWI